MGRRVLVRNAGWLKLGCHLSTEAPCHTDAEYRLDPWLDLLQVLGSCQPAAARVHHSLGTCCSGLPAMFASLRHSRRPLHAAQTTATWAVPPACAFQRWACRRICLGGCWCKQVCVRELELRAAWLKALELVRDCILQQQEGASSTLEVMN